MNNVHKIKQKIWFWRLQLVVIYRYKVTKNLIVTLLNFSDHKHVISNPNFAELQSTAGLPRGKQGLYVQFILKSQSNKKLSYCWETMRRESMPRIAEIDVEMTT